MRAVGVCVGLTGLFAKSNERNDPRRRTKQRYYELSTSCSVANEGAILRTVGREDTRCA
jgi:hypothetical protein